VVAPNKTAYALNTLLIMSGVSPVVLQLDWPTINLNSSGIFSISTFALSLLLVFRTNSSYER
jgi:predicted membrane chloride channel (bestrophin family)